MNNEQKYTIQKGHFCLLPSTIEHLIDLGVLQPFKPTRTVHRWAGSSIPVGMDWGVFIVKDKKPRLNEWLLEKCVEAGIIIKTEEIVGGINE